MKDTLYNRNLLPIVQDALSDTPVVYIRGARQSGKTTLVRDLLDGSKFQYFTLDSTTVLEAARSDPESFVKKIKSPVIVDEIQRAPDLVLAIKEEIDKRRRPGSFLLTGSANVLAIPRIADSLAGRMEILTLWPLSQGELAGVRESFLDKIFEEAPRVEEYPAVDLKNIAERIVKGGFPEPVGRAQPARRSAWFDSYITTIIERDVRSISNIHDISSISRILGVIASRTASIRDMSQIAQSIGMPVTSFARYMSMLDAVFFIYLVPAWTSNYGKRLIRSPKMYFTDTGIACHLIGVDSPRLLNKPDLCGTLFENFVASEICKQATWSRIKVRVFHFRAHTGQEVDLVLEDASGRVFGLEIKLASSVAAKQFSGLKTLKEVAGKSFVGGAVIYTGSTVLPFGDDLYAIPLSSVWA